ncbi:hypothetical protein KDL01_10825 [Actinospica durhamensis]|uniref:Uncharacterized protein n=1 Tax=Actinospica durhamensis TaxID=1508375 RepID=A0A941ELY8_9ACTN|nr:hypothetical protein [Actinospica durhamensis]MBR7833761.1 hypothetical protein [Actinospica durhamensis]
MADEEPETVHELRRHYHAFAARALPDPPLSDEELVAELRARAKSEAGSGRERAREEPQPTQQANGPETGQSGVGS